MASYLPTVESQLLSWAQNFNGFIAADPAAYSLSLEQAAAYSAALTAFSDALAVANNASTRTKPSIQAKNTAKKNLIALTRPLVNQIQAFSGTTDEMRADLQITIKDATPTSVPVPTMYPSLTVVAVMGRTIKVNLRARDADGNVSDSRARPVGVKGAAVYFASGEEYPQTIAGWSFSGNVSATTFDVPIPDSVAAGSKVYLTAQWYNTKSQTGPACPPVETSIARGLAQAA